MPEPIDDKHKKRRKYCCRCTPRESFAGQAIFILSLGATICLLLLPECAGGDDFAVQYFPSTIPSSLRPHSSSDDGVACNVAFYHIHVATDACTNISLSSSSIATQNLSVLVCTRPSSLTTGSGVIFLDTSQPRPDKATRVYRARLVGPEAHVLPVAYCSTYMAVATYPAAAAGNYSLELLQLYTSFTFNDVTPMQRNILLAKVAVDLVPVVTPGLAGRRMAQLAPCMDNNCSLCRTANAPGRWLLAPEAVPLLSHTCPPVDGAPQCHRDGAITAVPTALNDSLLRWQPYDCSLLPHSEHDACREKLHNVCFFGDSQMRHLFNSFVNPSFNTNASFWYLDTIHAPADKQQYTWPTYTYRALIWGHEFGSYDLSNCSSIVANFGQWAISKLSYKNVNGTDVSWPWTPSRYLRQVDVVAKQLQAAKHSGKRVWWATISSHAYVEWHVNSQDFRTDPYLLLYNSIASTIMHLHGIPIIDTHGITDTFKDLSYDGAHYKGYVGHWAGAAVAHALCSEQRAYRTEAVPARTEPGSSGGYRSAGGPGSKWRHSLAWTLANWRGGVTHRSRIQQG